MLSNGDRVTVVDGTTLVGLYAADGSKNVVNATAEATPVGVYHPSGATNITLVDGTSLVGTYAANGSLNVTEANDTSGAPKVTFGPELIINGDFDTDTDWTGANRTIASGVCSWSGANGNLNQTVSLVAGATYRVEFDVTAYTAGTVTPRLLGDTNVSGTARTAVGHYSEDIVAPANPTTVNLLGSGTPTLSVDNVSVRRIS